MTYFGEKRPKCQKQNELPCDVCQDWRKACNNIETLAEVLHAKEVAASAPQHPSNAADSSSDGSDQGTDQQEQHSSNTCSPEPRLLPRKTPLHKPVFKRKAGATWQRTPAAKQQPPANPLQAHNYSTPTGIVTSSDKQGTDTFVPQNGHPQAGACSANANSSSVETFVSSNGELANKRKRFKVPFKPPRPA